MAGKLTEVSAGVIAVKAANRLPTDNKEKTEFSTTRSLRSLEVTEHPRA